MADPLYIRARAALLDAAEALEAHRDALVLVGAQAVYLHTGDADLAVAAYTTDADFTVAPGDLADTPLLADLLGARGFTPREHPGGWLSPDPRHEPGVTDVHYRCRDRQRESTSR